EGIAKDGTGIVRMKWSDATMTVSARSEEKGEISAEIPVQPESLPGRVALNVKYLLEYLEGKDGVVTLGKDEGSSPALFHYGSKPVVAIMPMNVQWEDDKPKTEAPAEETTGENEESVEENPEATGEEAESPIEEETPYADVEESSPDELQSEPVTVAVTTEATSAENPPEPEPVKTPEKRRGRRKKT
ncbi:MAG: hypothetical protein PHU23_08015, partial [Dehalococcoidales bacterium]|nr:hypothetical protein [Dehalococcoidales bacterium]